jgi:aldose 1-epimerase
VDIIELSRGRTRAIVLPEAGGRLHQLAIRDGTRWLPLLRSPASPEKHLINPTAGGSYPMVPWPGRIDGGRFLWGGRVHTVPVNNGVDAIHGRGVYLPWSVESQSGSRCRLSCEFDGGWPFRGRATQQIEVSDRGIRQRIEILAAAGERFPAGIGWHPWFRRNVRPNHGPRVLVDADRVYETAEMIPTGWLMPAKRELDLRRYPGLGARRLDVCYRHPRGALRIRWGDIELTMTNSPNVTHAVVYTPREAICIEPQTCAPDAFNLAAQGVPGAGMAIVDRRHPLVATTAWQWTIGGGAGHQIRRRMADM